MSAITLAAHRGSVVQSRPLSPVVSPCLCWNKTFNEVMEKVLRVFERRKCLKEDDKPFKKKKDLYYLDFFNLKNLVTNERGWSLFSTKLRKLQELRAGLEAQLAAYKEGRAQGAGVAFVMFKDVYTANKAVQDFRNERSRRTQKFFSVTELRLQRNQWKVVRAHLATDIYWNHLALTKVALIIQKE